MQLLPNTAKIYQFPVRGRTNSNTGAIAQRIQRDGRSANAPAIVYGNWYHDAAIEDSRQPGKH